jgi:hypothetical protein
MTNPADYLEFTFNEETYKVRKKFKRLKFLRLMGDGELFNAIALALDPEELDRLDDTDLEEKELEDLLEIIAKTLLGKEGSRGN